jgi:hypothetical protein
MSDKVFRLDMTMMYTMHDALRREDPLGVTRRVG